MQTRNLDKYQLLECIACGGMGEVWKALDTQLQRDVAIKLLHPSIQQAPNFIMRFEDEARLIASLHHPNIIKIHDFKLHHPHIPYSPASDPPLCYMVMDYVQGGTLADYIGKTSGRGQFPPAVDIVYIFTVVGLALDYAHTRPHPVIHRDIKPANILLDQRIPTVRPMGEPILTDFGIARKLGTTSGTMTGSIVGTPKYIAPEQAQGEYDDPRSDLYSLGVILYEMMTGVAPFQADTPLAIVMQHLYEKPTPPEVVNPRITLALSEVILKSIAKDPHARFPTAAALALALAEAWNVSAPGHLRASGQPISASPSSYSRSLITSPPLHTSNTTQSSLSVLSPDQPMLFPDSQNHPSRTHRPRDLAKPHSKPEQASRRTKLSRFSHPQTWLIALLTLLILVLLGSGLSALLFFLPAGPGAEIVVGHVHFVQKGPSQGYNALQIDIGQVPQLPQGMAYYAWIELGTEETISPHWELPVSHQAIHTSPLTFAGFDTLYVPQSQLLITKERTDSPPIIPDPNPGARLYYARVTTPTLDLKACTAGNTAKVCI